MRCVICGKEVKNIISRDHVFPRALYLWQEKSLPENDYKGLKRAIESSSNIVKVHPECNYSKEEAMPDLEALFLTDRQKERLLEVQQRVLPFTEGYLQLKEAVLASQKGACRLCGKPLTNNGILRRIDKNGKRDTANAQVICHECNRKL